MKDIEGKELDKYLRAVEIVVKYLKNNPYLIDDVIKALEKMNRRLNE